MGDDEARTSPSALADLDSDAGDAMTVPNVVHFVFGLREQREPFHLVHYVAIESCRRLLAPETIYLHYRYLPYGMYWDLARPHLELVRVDLVPEVTHGPSDDRFVPERYRYAHHADFIRLDALIERGGIYLDIDTVIVRPFPRSLYQHAFVIGREAPVHHERTGTLKPSLCNAVLMAERGAEFARAWRRQMGPALDGTWSNHSGFLAESLSRMMAEAVHVERPRSFFPYGPNCADLTTLFERLELNTDGILSVHLWAHLWWERSRTDYSAFHAGLLTDEHVRAGTTTYGVLARPFLPELDLW
jgi:hypothetical protein